MMDDRYTFAMLLAQVAWRSHREMLCFFVCFVLFCFFSPSTTLNQGGEIKPCVLLKRSSTAHLERDALSGWHFPTGGEPNELTLPLASLEPVKFQRPHPPKKQARTNNADTTFAKPTESS